MSNPGLAHLPTTGRGGTFTCPHAAPYQENNEATLTCGPGYRLPSDIHSKVVLTARGILTWDPDRLDCLPLSELMDLPHTGTGGKFTSLETAPYHFHDTATLTCDLGYFSPAHRPVATVVVKNNQLVWEPESMDCQPVQCGAPPIPTFGRTSHQEYHFPQSFSYVCFEGYQFNQSLNQFFCNARGQWSPTIQGVNCDPIQCPELNAPLNGSVSFLDRFYNSVATFQCDPGMEMVQGEETRVCQNDGQWSGVDVKCGIVRCPPIDSRAKAIVLGQPITMIDCGQGKIVTLICKKGQWSQSYPYCPSSSGPPVIQPVGKPAISVVKPVTPLVKRATPVVKPPVNSPVVSSYISVGWLLLVIGFCFIFLSWCIRNSLKKK